MGVTSSGSDATLEAIASFMKALTDALTKRGLVAEPFGARMVWAKNPAADPPGGEPRATRMSPGLRQSVICQRDTESGGLAWFWVWSGATRDAPPELEYLCPAEHVDQAADKIAHVLGLNDTRSERVS